MGKSWFDIFYSLIPVAPVVALILLIVAIKLKPKTNDSFVTTTRKVCIFIATIILVVAVVLISFILLVLLGSSGH